MIKTRDLMISADIESELKHMTNLRDMWRGRFEQLQAALGVVDEYLAETNDLLQKARNKISEARDYL
jgi:hypothetical protein